MENNKLKYDLLAEQIVAVPQFDDVVGTAGLCTGRDDVPLVQGKGCSVRGSDITPTQYPLALKGPGLPVDSQSLSK